MPDNNVTNAQVSSAPTNKAVAATGGSAVGSAIATIVLHALTAAVGSIPEDVKGAIVMLVTAVVTALVAYSVPPGQNDGIMAVQKAPAA